VGLGNRAVLGTVDGGTTWSPQGIPGSVFLRGIACPGPKTCEAVGQTADDRLALYRTDNGGGSWKRQHVGGA
jgi:photosystem II stability/assembly factor-like uncharacterized protein